MASTSHPIGRVWAGAHQCGLVLVRGPGSVSALAGTTIFRRTGRYSSTRCSVGGSGERSRFRHRTVATAPLSGHAHVPRQLSAFSSSAALGVNKTGIPRDEDRSPRLSAQPTRGNSCHVGEHCARHGIPSAEGCIGPFDRHRSDANRLRAFEDPMVRRRNRQRRGR
jgi:hypothetical protein